MLTSALFIIAVALPLCSADASIDLRNHDFNSSPAIISGKWDLYPLQFINDDQANADPLKADIPSFWESPIPSEGFASFRRSILLPDKPARYGILYRDAASTYLMNVYCSEKLQFSGGAGKPGRSGDQSIPWLSYTCAEMELSGRTTMIFHVANYDLAHGGMWNAPVIGGAEVIRRYRERIIARDFFLIGILLLVACFSGILFTKQRSNNAPLYLAIFCILMAVRTLITGLYPQEILKPSRTAFSILLKLDYLTMSAGVPVFILYLKSIFPGLMKKTGFAACIPGIIFSGFIIASPLTLVSRFTAALWLYMIITLCTVFILFIVLIKARRDKMAALCCGAITIFTATILNDILYSLQFLPGPLTAPFGFAAFIIVQGYIVAELRERDHRQIQMLEGELTQMRHRFDEMVSGKADELQSLLRKKKIEAQRHVPAETQDKIAGSIEFIQKNYMDDISREGLAARAEMSPSRFGKAFLICTGITLHDYINQLRINASLNPLREKDHSITQIALDTGFESLSTFNRAFRKMTGITPSRYRNECATRDIVS